MTGMQAVLANFIVKTADQDIAASYYDIEGSHVDREVSLSSLQSRFSLAQIIISIWSTRPEALQPSFKYSRFLFVYHLKSLVSVDKW